MERLPAWWERLMQKGCWVPLAKSKQVNDLRRKTPVLQTLPGTNHCQREGDCLVSLAPLS